MRRVICITMTALFLTTIIIAIVESHVHPGRADHHIIVAVLFIVSAIAHVVLNWRTFVRYLGGWAAK